ncbi:NAD-specific glutamate dehydrogenase [compost metagenome]
MIQAIGNGRGGRLIQQAQHVQASQASSIARRLALCVVKVSGHGNHRAHQIVAQYVFGALAQHRQNLSRHLNRAQVALHRANAHHAGRVHKLVRRPRGARLFQRAAHESLHGHHSVQGIFSLLRQRLAAGGDFAASKITHRRRQQGMALRIWQHFSHAAAHSRNEGIGSAQINAHRQLALVRRGRLTGLGYLQ